MGPPLEHGDRAVEAFIAARRGPVLARAVADLSECSVSELAEVTHRLVGTLGSYDLVRAQLVVEPVRDAAVASGPQGRSRSDLAELRDQAVVALTRLAAELAESQAVGTGGRAEEPQS